MNRDQRPAGHLHPPPGDEREDRLCPEREEFARVLGRLLARLWARERGGREVPRPDAGATPIRASDGADCGPDGATPLGDLGTGPPVGL